jgi:hypothetical protein
MPRCFTPQEKSIVDSLLLLLSATWLGWRKPKRQPRRVEIRAWNCRLAAAPKK